MNLQTACMQYPRLGGPREITPKITECWQVLLSTPFPDLLILTEVTQQLDSLEFCNGFENFKIVIGNISSTINHRVFQILRTLKLRGLFSKI